MKPTTRTFWSGVSGDAVTVNNAPARMIETVLVGPKTRCREFPRMAQTAPPMTAVISTACTGIPTTSAKPSACGMVTIATIAAEASARNLSQEYLRNSRQTGGTGS
jgi:hypothetical protein